MPVGDDAARRQKVLRKLYTATAICCIFMVVEVAGGLIAHSLAILSDAAHLFADLASFLVAIGASYLASLPATRKHTFGLKRTESLAALLSMLSLGFVSIGLCYEAVRRLINPPEESVQGPIMSVIAGIGVLVNVILAMVLGENHVHLPGYDGHSHEHGHCSHGGGGGHDHGSHNDGSHDHDSHDHKSHDHGSHDHDSHDHCSHDHKSHENGSHDHDSHDHGSHDDKSHDHGSHDHDSHEHSSHDHKSHDHNSHSHNSHDHKSHDHNNSSDNDDQVHDETAGLVSSSEHSDSHYGIHSDVAHADEVAAHVEIVDNGNVNLRAAYLHVLADLAQSVAVLTGGLVIWIKPEWDLLDPLLTLLFCILVLWGAWGVVRSSVSVLLEETPPSISWQRVHDAIAAVPTVTDIHDLHIWSISDGQVALSVHCQATDPHAMANIKKICVKNGIGHPTIQIQTREGACLTCDDHLNVSRQSGCVSNMGSGCTDSENLELV